MHIPSFRPEFIARVEQRDREARVFNYLRENPTQLVAGIVVMVIFIILLIAVLDVKFGILDDPHQKKQRENH